MNLQEINAIYNGLETKDMPRQEFVKKVQNLTDPAGMQRDLGVIMGMKQTAMVKKQEIDRAVSDEG